MNEKNDEIPVNQFDFDAKQIFPDAATMRQRMPSKVPADLFNMVYHRCTLAADSNAFSECIEIRGYNLRFVDALQKLLREKGYEVKIKPGHDMFTNELLYEVTVSWAPSIPVEDRKC